MALSEQTKRRIVIALARCESPSEIVKALADEGIKTDPKNVGRYDPTRPYYEAGQKWKTIFEEERAKYLADMQDIPIANQAYRLRMLQQTLEKAMTAGNRVLANATLRQAAEEVGGALTNERNVKMSRTEEMTPEERRTAFVSMLEKVMERAGNAPSSSAQQ